MRVFPTGKDQGRGQLARAGLQGLLRPLLKVALRLRWFVVGAAVLLFGSSLWLFTKLGAEFIPQLDEDTMLLQFICSGSAGLTASTTFQQPVGLSDFSKSRRQRIA